MTSNASINILKAIIEKEKLSETNFLDRHQNLRIVLKHEKKLYVLDEPLPEAEPPARDQSDAYSKHLNDVVQVSCIMLATINFELENQLENMTTFDMIKHVKTLYEEQARHERFDVSKALSKLICWKEVGPHVLKMIGYVENLERLGLPFKWELTIYLILQSFPNLQSLFLEFPHE